MALVLHLSGGAGNTNPNFSLGGVISTTTIIDAVDNNLYDDITRKETLISKTEYRSFYVKNTDASLPVHGAYLFFDEFPTKSIVTMGLDPIGSGDGVASGVAQLIALEDTAPTGVTFESAGEFTFKLALPTLKPLESQAIWIRRIAEAASGESVTAGLTVTGNDSDFPAAPVGSEFHGEDGLNMTGERTAVVASVRPFTIGVARIGLSIIE